MPQPVLTTDRLILRPFASSDAEVVARLLHDGRIAATTARIPYPYTIEDARAWIGSRSGDVEQDNGVVFAITRPDARGSVAEIIGSIGLELYALAIMRGVGELGYWIATDHQGCGYATEAGRAVIDYGFSDLELRRVEAHTFDNNPASMRVLANLGMSREGVMRDRIIRNGTTHDTIHYAVLRDSH